MLEMIDSLFMAGLWLALFIVLTSVVMEGLGKLLAFLDERFTKVNRWFVASGGEFWTIALLQAGILGLTIFIVISLACELLFW